MSGQRYDISRLAGGNVARTPSGGARIPARLTRTGVFTYRQPDGTIRRELRPADEVFKADSLATLQDAPVLVGHPAMVDPKNWREYSRGHVSGTPRADTQFVEAPLAIQDADTLAKIDSGELSEISCGYVCRTDNTPGVTDDGQHYDAIQRDIRYNHVGLGGRNWGRAGSDVALRLDGGVCDFLESERGTAPERKRMPLIRFDGKDYEAGSDDHLKALYTKLDATEAACKEATARAEKLDGQVATLTAANTQLTESLATANDPKRLDSLIDDRVRLVQDAAKVLGPEYKFDGKTALEIKSEVVRKARPEVKLDGRSEDWITGAFETACQSGIRTDTIEAVPGTIAEIEARRLQYSKTEQVRKDAADKARAESRKPRFESPALNSRK